MRRFAQSAGYARARASLGAIYVLLGALILVRTCVPLSGMSWSKISPVVLGMAIAGLGIVRIREFLLMRKNASP